MERVILLSFHSDTALFLIRLLTLLLLKQIYAVVPKQREEKEMSSMPTPMLLGRIVLCYPLQFLFHLMQFILA